MKITKLIIIIPLLILSVSTACDKVEFDSEKWKSWEESEYEPSLRWNMSKDLVKKHKLKTFTYEKVIELLGKPDKEINNELWYYLGMSGRGINTGSLILTTENGKVIDYKITEG